MAGLQRNKFKVALYQRMLGLANRLAALPNRLTPPPFRLIQIGSAFWQSRALYTAATLGLADELGDGEMSAGGLAASLQLHEDHLYRLLRMLASIGVFAETGHRRFRNSKLSAHLRQDHPHSVRAMILMHNAQVMTKPWTDFLPACVRSGSIPFAQANGTGLYTYLDAHAEFDQLFSQAMDEVEALTGDDYLGDFDWTRFDRIIDVGGSHGSKSLSILRSCPRLRAVVFDRPQVVADAAARWQGNVEPEILRRLEFVGGDMFESIPVAVSDRDLFLFIAVFHGLGDQDAHRLLANLKHAFGDHRPSVLVVDTVAAATRIDPTVAAFDMQMLVNTEGRERTVDEWRELFEPAGFGIREIIDVRTFAKFILVRPL
jgi:hypothetical protein